MISLHEILQFKILGFSTTTTTTTTRRRDKAGMKLQQRRELKSQLDMRDFIFFLAKKYATSNSRKSQNKVLFRRFTKSLFFCKNPNIYSSRILLLKQSVSVSAGILRIFFPSIYSSICVSISWIKPILKIILGWSNKFLFHLIIFYLIRVHIISD